MPRDSGMQVFKTSQVSRYILFILGSTYVWFRDIRAEEGEGFKMRQIKKIIIKKSVRVAGLGMPTKWKLCRKNVYLRTIRDYSCGTDDAWGTCTLIRAALMTGREFYACVDHSPYRTNTEWEICTNHSEWNCVWIAWSIRRIMHADELHHLIRPSGCMKLHEWRFSESVCRWAFKRWCTGTRHCWQNVTGIRHAQYQILKRFNHHYRRIVCCDGISKAKSPLIIPEIWGCLY